MTPSMTSRPPSTALSAPAGEYINWIMINRIGIAAGSEPSDAAGGLGRVVATQTGGGVRGEGEGWFG